MSNCSKCGEKLGFLSGFVLGEKTFCSKCYDSLSIEERRALRSYECRECKYFYVDSDYDSWCEITGAYTDRDKKSCPKFEKS